MAKNKTGWIFIVRSKQKDGNWRVANSKRFKTYNDAIEWIGSDGVKGVVYNVQKLIMRTHFPEEEN